MSRTTSDTADGDTAAHERTQLVSSARRLGIELTEARAATLQRLLDELAKWNRTYNLTALRTRAEWVTHHVLDSLSVAPLLQGRRIADVGTGAGFPGLPLAILRTDCNFTLIDSNGKKTRFVEHVARTLGLTNVTVLQARAENLRPGSAEIAEAFDTVIARAFAALPDLTAAVRELCGPNTVLLALKGKRPDAEIRALNTAQWCVAAVTPVAVPDLDAARHVVTLRRLS